jgi:hypothetical protein
MNAPGDLSPLEHADGRELILSKQVAGQEDCNSHEAARLGRSARHRRPAIASISRALSRPLAAEERLNWLIRGR